VRLILNRAIWRSLDVTGCLLRKLGDYELCHVIFFKKMVLPRHFSLEMRCVKEISQNF
jgi:hypothetical protein